MRGHAYLAALAVLLGLGVATPLVAHEIGAACWVWLPAHWPVLLAGLALGLRAGILVGLATMVTELVGRHTIGAVPAATEMLTYGIVAGLVGEHARNLASRYAGLFAAMASGRIVYALVSLIWLGRSLASSFERSVVFPWPGIVVQLAVLPLIAAQIARFTPRQA